MSYSITARGTNKIAALASLVAEFDKVVAGQPVHDADRTQALTAAQAFVGLIPDPNENQEVYVTMSGSVSWNGSGSDTVIQAASVNVSAMLMQKEKA